MLLLNKYNNKLAISKKSSQLFLIIKTFSGIYSFNLNMLNQKKNQILMRLKKIWLFRTSHLLINQTNSNAHIEFLSHIKGVNPFLMFLADLTSSLDKYFLCELEFMFYLNIDYLFGLFIMKSMASSFCWFFTWHTKRYLQENYYTKKSL